VDARKLSSTLKWEVLFQVRRTRRTSGHDLDGFIDMLRYDRVTPATQGDVALMNKLRDPHQDGGGTLPEVVITLKAFTETKSWAPTVARWQSMGWEVVL
jgi:hypothetical protein